MDGKITLNVGGQYFVTHRQTLQRAPGTRLYGLTKSDSAYVSEDGEYFFDRNPQYFGAILDFYRHGQLHFSHCLCGPAIRQELLFWGLDENCISACCWRAFLAADEERQTLEKLEKTLIEDEREDAASEQTAVCGCHGNTSQPDDHDIQQTTEFHCHGNAPHSNDDIQKSTFEEEQLESSKERTNNCGGTWKNKMWRFLEKPQSSKVATVS